MYLLSNMAILCYFGYLILNFRGGMPTHPRQAQRQGLLLRAHGGWRNFTWPDAGAATSRHIFFTPCWNELTKRGTTSFEDGHMVTVTLSSWVKTLQKGIRSQKGRDTLDTKQPTNYLTDMRSSFFWSTLLIYQTLYWCNWCILSKSPSRSFDDKHWTHEVPKIKNDEQTLSGIHIPYVCTCIHTSL